MKAWSKFKAMPGWQQAVYGVVTLGVTATTLYFAGKGAVKLYHKMFKSSTETMEHGTVEQKKEPAIV